MIYVKIYGNQQVSREAAAVKRVVCFSTQTKSKTSNCQDASQTSTGKAVTVIQTTGKQRVVTSKSKTVFWHMLKSMQSLWLEALLKGLY